jgi:hypothetical protein
MQPTGSAGFVGGQALSFYGRVVAAISLSLAAVVPAGPLLTSRRGRRTSSPWQLGQIPLSALAQVAQKVHS